MSRASREKVVIIGANGTMGAAAAAVFAGAGYAVTMLARDLDKAAQGLKAAQAVARAEALAERVRLGCYDGDLAREAGQAMVIFESLAEDLALKKEFLARVDRYRSPDCLVATGSSGLSIGEMARPRSESFRRHFLGIHLFNPPHLVVGAEIIPHLGTDPAVVSWAVAMLAGGLGRKVIVTRDRPAFVGNRVGFKVLNEVAQLSARHGVEFADYLIGSHTGRAMAPLATIDLVGWDVHKAIVANVFAHCPQDEAHECFRMPEFMEAALARGCLGDKTPDHGGFYRRRDGRVEALDPTSLTYRPMVAPRPLEFVERMKKLHRVGKYHEALQVLRDAREPEADIARRVVLGYISYALNRVGEVAASARDVDTIMSYGFNWAPPCVLVDLMGARETIAMLERYELKVPPVVAQAAAGARLFTGGVLDYGRTFAA